VLPSQLVRFEAGGGTDPGGAAPAAGAPVTPAPAPAPAPSAPSAAGTQAGTQVESAVVPSVTTTTTAPAPAPASTAGGEEGEATWYAAAAPGRCASPTLPFGTVLTVTNVATGARTVCTVDDREQAGYPRVVDLSPSGFDQLAGLGRGVVDVVVSW
jgi:rare lipoprotein A